MKNGGLDFAINFFRRTVRLVFSGHARSSGTLFIIVLLRSTCLLEKKEKEKKSKALFAGFERWGYDKGVVGFFFLMYLYKKYFYFILIRCDFYFKNIVPLKKSTISLNQTQNKLRFLSS